MKRSEINKYIREAERLFAEAGFKLPPWAGWSGKDWRERSADCRNIFASGLGWDLTDFGGGDYLKRGLLLVTVRNGNGLDDKKPYAEKLMLVKEEQETPFHFHWHKTEDIINRGGGILVIELYNSDADGEFTDTDVSVLTDGITRRLNAGGRVSLAPGESITLPTGQYHRFFAEAGGGPVIAGEVSMTNDDASDNRFYEECGRFPDIDEDEPAYRLLVGDYAPFQGGTA